MGSITIIRSNSEVSAIPGGAAYPQSPASTDDLHKVTLRGAETTNILKAKGFRATDLLTVPLIEPVAAEDEIALFFDPEGLSEDIEAPESVDLSSLYKHSLSSEYQITASIINGLLIQTNIPYASTTNYINIILNGFGGATARPFDWRGQIYNSEGAFSANTMRSLSIGEPLDVRIFQAGGLVCIWVTGRTVTISTLTNIRVQITLGRYVRNRVDNVFDAAFPSTGITDTQNFKDQGETYLPPFTSSDRSRLDSAVTALNGAQYKIWTGSLADYTELTKDDLTFYFIV